MSASRNVPVSLAEPLADVYRRTLWVQINQLAGGNPEFTPVEIKSMYVIGLIHDICRSVEWLLRADDAWPEKYLPAFAVFASGVDLLGRCVSGNPVADLNANLRTGFYYLVHPSATPCPLPDDTADEVVTRTPRASYSVGSLTALRHYTAHGQATSKGRLPSVDNELLAGFPRLVGDAIDTYWEGGLKGNVEFCLRMGRARIDPYANRAGPLRKVYEYFTGPNSAGSLFKNLDWRVRVG